MPNLNDSTSNENEIIGNEKKGSERRSIGGGSIKNLNKSSELMKNMKNNRKTSGAIGTGDRLSSK